MTLLATRFREEVSKCKDYRMKCEMDADVSYSTGFLAFDFINGSIVHVKSVDKNFTYYSVGLTDGSMVTVIGRSGCGKSTWTVQASANIIRPFKTSCMFLDSVEGGLEETRGIQLTKFSHEEYKQRVICRNAGVTLENFYERIKMVHDIKLNDRTSFEYDTGYLDSFGNHIYKLEPTVFILDSLAMLISEKFADEDELSGNMAATQSARNNATAFKRIIPLLKSANIILMVINHINDKVSTSSFTRTKSQVSYLKPDETLNSVGA